MIQSSVFRIHLHSHDRHRRQHHHQATYHHNATIITIMLLVCTTQTSISVGLACVRDDYQRPALRSDDAVRIRFAYSSESL